MLYTLQCIEYILIYILYMEKYIAYIDNCKVFLRLIFNLIEKGL